VYAYKICIVHVRLIRKFNIKYCTILLSIFDIYQIVTGQNDVYSRPMLKTAIHYKVSHNNEMHD